MRWLGVLLLIGCGGARTPATTSTADVVDRIVATVMAEAHVPGMAVAVVKDGIVHEARGYGAGTGTAAGRRSPTSCGSPTRASR